MFLDEFSSISHLVMVIFIVVGVITVASIIVVPVCLIIAGKHVGNGISKWRKDREEAKKPIICKFCGAKNNKNATKCSECGAPFEK